jgi:hypothetical protein
VQRQSQRIHFGENNHSEGAEGEEANAPRIDEHKAGETPARKFTCAKTRGSKMQASRCAKQNNGPREKRRAGKSTQPPAGCNGAQKSCNHELTGSRCPTPITVTHLRTYGQAFDVTRLYIAMWMSKKKGQRKQIQAADAAIHNQTESSWQNARRKRGMTKQRIARLQKATTLRGAQALMNLVVRLHESSQPVKAKTVKEKTMEFHTGPRPSR